MADDCRGDNFSDASNPKSLQIAYLILAHKQPELVIRLIKALNEPGHIFVVHVDLKSAKCTTSWRTGLTTFNKRQEVNRKIYMVPKAHSIGSRGGWSMVEATLACMRQARGTNHSFSWMMLISESSYPLQSNHRIRATLAAAGAQGDIVHEVETEPSARPPDRWYSYIDCDDRLHRVSRLVLPRGITLYSGSQWWAISSTVSRWLLSLDKAGLPEQFAAYARRTAVPDETYFANVVHALTLLPKNYKALNGPRHLV